METVTSLLEGPVRVWHLLLLAMLFWATLSNIQKRISVVANGLLRVLKKLDPEF